MEEKLDILRT